jgi:hypothetical protein
MKALTRLLNASLLLGCDNENNTQPLSFFTIISTTTNSSSITDAIIHAMKLYVTNVLIQIEGQRLLWNIMYIICHDGRMATTADLDYNDDAIVEMILQCIGAALDCHPESQAYHETSICILSKIIYVLQSSSRISSNSITTNIDMEKKLPIFELKPVYDFPLESSLLPAFKRKILNYIIQKNTLKNLKK